MTPTDIFRGAIQKAIDNNWNAFTRKPLKEIEGIQWEVIGVDKIGLVELVPVLVIKADGGNIKFFYEVEQVIFDHDFARAIFGEAEQQTIVLAPGTPAQNTGNIGWERHICSMVLSKSRLDYLYDHM